MTRLEPETSAGRRRSMNRGSRNRAVAIVGAIGLQAATAIGVTAQTPSAADGPWGGWARCVLVARGGNYVDEQVHTWRITGPKPRVTGSIRHWPGVWTAE